MNLCRCYTQIWNIYSSHYMVEVSFARLSVFFNLVEYLRLAVSRYYKEKTDVIKTKIGGQVHLHVIVTLNKKSFKISTMSTKSSQNIHIIYTSFSFIVMLANKNDKKIRKSLIGRFYLKNIIFSPQQRFIRDIDSIDFARF